jgi:glycosyltransferase involved in cell wall biosynthesis
VLGPSAPANERVVHLSDIADDELRALYRGATAVAMPSYHEAFGLPMIEAMACGTPVVASRAAALPEVGEGAALYADPDDPEDWSAALLAVAGDERLRRRMREAGLRRAAAFDWETCALRHLNVFREAVAG